MTQSWLCSHPKRFVFANRAERRATCTVCSADVSRSYFPSLVPRVGCKASRRDVYNALDTERDYQDAKWTPETTSTSGRHSVTEFLAFMDSYLREAIDTVSRNGEPQASVAALHIVRKIAAMGVACMEQHGAPVR